MHVASGWRRISCAAALALGAIAVHAFAVRAQPAAGASEPRAFLRTVARFSPSDFAALDRGEPVARVLDTERREVAIVGAIRIKAPRERLLDRYRDVSSLRGSGIVLEVGTFGNPPRAEDLKGLSPETYDLERIRDCRPGDCGVRVSAETMARFGREVNWRAGDWREQAGSLWRRVLAEYAAGYRATGALGDYRNKATPLSVAEEFDVLFEQSRDFSSIAPEFFAYLQGFPRATLEGAEDILYWEKDDIGLRPITSITHLTLYTPGHRGPQPRRPALVATKQIYATHYFDAGLGLTLAFDDGPDGFYMLSLNRARTRSLQGFMRALVRSTVLRRSRDAMEHVLRSTRQALERPGQEEGGAPAARARRGGAERARAGVGPREQ
jgi:hypothetical protein